MRGDMLSAQMMAAAKTTVNAPGSQGGKYGLGLMRNSFLGNTAYGHGGDLAYHASSWYFPEKDLSITVFTNDDKKDSWKLLPVITELLRTCMNYMPVSPTDDLAETGVEFKAYPNPFEDGFTVAYSLPAIEGDMTLTLTNSLGQQLQSMRCDAHPNSRQSFNFDGLESLNPGIYFLTMKVNGTAFKTIKLIKSPKE